MITIGNRCASGHDQPEVRGKTIPGVAHLRRMRQRVPDAGELGGIPVAVYQFSAVRSANQHQTEEGTVVARNKFHAMDLLNQRGLVNARFKQLTGLSAVFRQWTADIR